MAMKGMDVEQVEQFGNQMRNEISSQLNDLRTTIKNRAQGLNWEGQDAREFIDDRIQGCSNQFDQLRTKIEEYGRTAVNNAQAQADVSAVL